MIRFWLLIGTLLFTAHVRAQDNGQITCNPAKVKESAQKCADRMKAVGNKPVTSTTTTYDPAKGMTANAAGAVTATREIIGESERTFAMCEGYINECRGHCTFNDTGEPVASHDYCGDPKNGFLPRAQPTSTFSRNGSQASERKKDPCHEAVEKLGQEGLDSLNELKQAEEEQMNTLRAVAGNDPEVIDKALKTAERERAATTPKQSPAQITPVATDTRDPGATTPGTSTPSTSPGSAQVVAQPGTDPASPAQSNPVAGNPIRSPSLPLPSQLPVPVRGPQAPAIFALPNPVNTGGVAQVIPQPANPIIGSPVAGGPGIVGPIATGPISFGPSVTTPTVVTPTAGGPGQIVITPASVDDAARYPSSSSAELSRQGVALENGPSLFTLSSTAYGAFCRGDFTGTCPTAAH